MIDGPTDKVSCILDALWKGASSEKNQESIINSSQENHTFPMSKENDIGPAVRDILRSDRQTNTHRDIILFLYKDIDNYKIVI